MTPSEQDPTVRYELDGGVAVITLNRPHALNAINAALAVALGDVLERADSDPAVQVIVVTGAGRAFCAGADLKAVAAGEELSDTAHPERGVAGFVRHWVGKPTICAVNGLALGGGTELVLAADLAIADERAEFALPEVMRGLVAGAGGLVRLASQIPRKIALEIALTGGRVNAERAAALGLINDVVPAGTSLQAAIELGQRIAANAPVAVRESKALIHRSGHVDDWDADVWADNDAVLKAVFASADAREGAVAFAEKRTPVWQGR